MAKASVWRSEGRHPPKAQKIRGTALEIGAKGYARQRGTRGRQGRPMGKMRRPVLRRLFGARRISGNTFCNCCPAGKKVMNYVDQPVTARIGIEL